MRPEDSDPADKCPVDPRTRERWLEAAKAKKAKAAAQPPLPRPTPTTPLPTASRYSLDSGSWQPLTLSSRPPRTSRQPKQPPVLPTDREVSTIPRALQAKPDSLNSAERAALPSPANNEADTGHDVASGNWVYPSQQMFFAAMQRKGHAAAAKDMSSIVPIHNAVNERAWSEIKAWEAGRGSEECGGPKLVSFAGDSKALTPRARWNMWFKGSAEPFDRHDWVVERCGTKVGYVIDFYAGKHEGKAGAEGLNFFLDVRPKLDSWEGMKMRAQRAVGM
ncbi:hypothetical protein LTR08_003324 [Meristemomyces frigidus]|nr:hypothetical protein LTR08_003324 [Meristemomyces frigidus]